MYLIMKLSSIGLTLILLVTVVILGVVCNSYRRVSHRIEDKYVIHLKRNSKILEDVLTYNENINDIDLSVFVESLNSIEMMMDLLLNNTIQSEKDIEVINSMWALNSSVMSAIVFKDSKNNPITDDKVRNDLVEILSFYNEFGNGSHVKWDTLIKEWQRVLDKYLERYPNNIYFDYYINKYEIE